MKQRCISRCLKLRRHYSTSLLLSEPRCLGFPSFFFLVTVDAVEEYIIFPVIILRLARLLTRVKPRKHKSNKLVLVYSDASVITRRHFFSLA